MSRAVRGTTRTLRLLAGGVAIAYALSCGLGDDDRSRQQLGDSDAGLYPPPVDLA